MLRSGCTDAVVPPDYRGRCDAESRCQRARWDVLESLAERRTERSTAVHCTFRISANDLTRMVLPLPHRESAEAHGRLSKVRHQTGVAIDERRTALANRTVPEQ